MIAAYRKSIEDDPAFVPASFDLGVAYYNRGEYNEAIPAYQQVIKYDDSNAQAHENLASTYRQLERYPDANSEYKAAAETFKDDAGLFNEWGYCLESERMGQGSNSAKHGTRAQPGRDRLFER